MYLPISEIFFLNRMSILGIFPTSNLKTLALDNMKHIRYIYEYSVDKYNLSTDWISSLQDVNWRSHIGRYIFLIYIFDSSKQAKQLASLAGRSRNWLNNNISLYTSLPTIKVVKPHKGRSWTFFSPDELTHTTSRDIVIHGNKQFHHFSIT